MTEHSSPSFTALADLASSRVGGRALAANDEFFAARANLLKPEPATFIPGKYTTRGKWMDGWESRRRRTPGHDWCVIALGMPGVVRGVNIATHFFTGNFPSHASIDAIAAAAGRLAASTFAQADGWAPLLPKSELRGDANNFFAVDSPQAWTHLRLNIYPDGGVARLRVYGEPAVDWARLTRKGRAVDLAALEHGGLVVDTSDHHYGDPNNMLMPGRAPNMGDGWETRRRRGPGHDWAIVRLGARGHVSEVEIDTNHYKGNYPDSASLDGALRDGTWTTLLKQTKLRPHHRHYFTKELAPAAPVTHVRLNIYPDGGISRLRVYGHLATS